MIIIYDGETGRIEQTVHDPVPKDYDQHLASENQSFIFFEAESDEGMNLYENFYVEAEILTARPRFDLPARIELAVGESVTLSVPAGTNLSVDDQDPVLIEGLSLEIESDLPAEYDLRLFKFPYVDHSIEVVINEA